jgi:chromosome partitioning protein
MGKVISIINQKGGVGKTTTTMNLGWALINKGKKVLMIDFDPQSSLTISMDLDPELQKNTIYKVLNGLDIYKAMLTDKNNFYFLPNNVDASALEIDLIGKQKVLKSKLDAVKEEFDYVLIDCPPSLGAISINALVASDYVIIPMQLDFLAYKGFELIMQTIEKVKGLNPAIDLMGVLPTMYKITRHSKEMLEIIQSNHKAFKTVIPDSVKFKDATVEGVPINEFDKKLGKLYEGLAKEVIDYGKKVSVK